MNDSSNLTKAKVWTINDSSNLTKAKAVKEIKDVVRAQNSSSPALSKSLDIFDTLLCILNGLCHRYNLSYEDHKIIVYVFSPTTYPGLARTFIIDVIEGTMKSSFL